MKPPGRSALYLTVKEIAFILDADAAALRQVMADSDVKPKGRGEYGSYLYDAREVRPLWAAWLTKSSRRTW